MIDKIKIEHFKSIVDLEFEPGRFNVIIGANGCGKTNVLEAITFAAAESLNRLDNEYLGNRLRYTAPEYMLSAFDDGEDARYINISVMENGNELSFEHLEVADLQKQSGHSERETWITAVKIVTKRDAPGATVENIIERIDSYLASKNLPKLSVLEIEQLFRREKPLFLSSFLIYCPEETKLRTFSDDALIQPLGRRGEGLFQHLKELVVKGGNKEIIAEINEGLSLLDWVDEIKIPKDLLSNEFRLEVGDKYLKDSLHYFDQRSTNEGFLYLLFYLTLFSSKQTPVFFAIDNIENSFNPKLCTALIRKLVQLAKKNDKQVIVTTHNPYVLDGLDLSDDEQRLFVARRNIDGHTKLDRIAYKEERKMKLSEIWMNGFIGGLPDNF